MALTLSIASFLIALIALFVNVSGLARRPRIVADWGWVQERPPYEGLSLIVTARRRPVEVDEIGVVLLPRRTPRRKVGEWMNADDPYRVRIRTQADLPAHLQDGQTVRGFAELEWLIDEIGDNRDPLYAYVVASGSVYLASPRSQRLVRGAIRKLRRKLKR